MKRSDPRLDRLLGGKPHLGVAEREAVLEAVLGATAPARPAPSSPWVRWALALALLLLGPIVYFAVPRETGGLVARGGKLEPSFTLSCLVDGQPAACRRGAKLVFAPAPGDGAVFTAVAETPGGETVWLFESVPVAELGQRAVVLDGAPGTWVVHGLFTPAPLSRDAAREALSKPELAPGRVTIRTLEVQ